ncbi:hypothetical protein VNO77_42022 [Canavalia gladiata]|uniref:Uncharacterized protein n=1 Tax=Canavalia gladiata TaxID=3824 RepID=A0AAN9PSH1_CANGL
MLLQLHFAKEIPIRAYRDKLKAGKLGYHDNLGVNQRTFVTSSPSSLAVSFLIIQTKGASTSIYPSSRESLEWVFVVLFGRTRSHDHLHAWALVGYTICHLYSKGDSLENRELKTIESTPMVLGEEKILPKLGGAESGCLERVLMFLNAPPFLRLEPLTSVYA